MTPATPSTRAPLAAAIACFTSWGVYPLVFQGVGALGATPMEMLAWRAVTAVPFAIWLVMATGTLGDFTRTMASPRRWAPFVLSGALIGGNWAVYIWAVSNHRTLDASLGYYINPLMSVAVGAVVFRERLDRFGQAAIALAALGVGLQAAALGAMPWIALSLAACFCFYGVVRKLAPAESQVGLLIECLVLLVPSLAYCGWLAAHGRVVLEEGWPMWLALLGTGAVTIGPLALFGFAARRLSFTTIAFCQFIAPTMVFIVGALEGEPMSPLRLASFGFIWVGVAVFGWGAAKAARREG